MAEFWYRLATPSKRHCLAKLTLYVHVCDGLYASWRVKATLRYRFKTLDRKPRPRSQSYIGPTTVGPDRLLQATDNNNNVEKLWDRVRVRARFLFSITIIGTLMLCKVVCKVFWTLLLEYRTKGIARYTIGI